MHGQSPVVAAVVLVAVAIGLAVLSGSFVTNIVATTSSSSEAQEIGAGMISVIDARLTTPYTWKVVVQNLTDQNLDLGSLGAAVYRDDHVCGTAKGFVADSNILGPHAVETLYFYGDLDCRLESGDWELRIFSPTGFATISKVRPPEDVYLWIPFKSVHSMDWSGRHKVFFKTGKTATIYGAHDGNAQEFNWAQDIFSGVRGDALFFPSSFTQRRVVVEDSNATVFDGNAFTVSMWLFVPADINSVTGYRRAITKGVLSDRQWNIFFNSNTKSFAVEMNFQVGGPCATFTFNLPPGWHHVVFAHEDNGVEKLFLDGAAYAECTGAGILEKNNGPLAIGGWGISGADQWYGGIDDVRYYGHVLTDGEIAALYRGEDVRDGLVLHYTFDRNTIDTEANTIYDVHMWGRGIVEGGFWLDGNKTYAVFQADVNYIASSYSYVAWVRQLKDDTEVVVVATTTANATIFLDVNTGNPCIQIDYNYTSPGSARVCIYDLNVLGRDALLTLTYDIANGIASVCAAMDGTIECNAVEYNALADSPDPNLAIATEKIGTQWAGAPARMWTRGLIDEVRVYKRALSRDEIACIYNDPECLIDDGNLVVMFTFDFPNRAWEDVPEWNIVPAAPRFRRYDVREMVVNTNAGDSIYVRLTQPAPHSVVSGFRPLADLPKVGVPHTPFGLGDSSGSTGTASYLQPEQVTTSGTIPAAEGYCKSTWDCAIVYREWNVGTRYTLGGAYSDGLLYAIFEDETNTYSTSYAPTTDLFYVGIDPSGSTATYGSYAFLLALNRLLDSHELLALCKLFGTC